MFWFLAAETRKCRRGYSGPRPGPPGTKRYLTINNGARTWIVEDHPGSKRVIIYKNNEADKTEEKVLEIPYKKLWLSHSDGVRFGGEGPWYRGNTVLIEKTDGGFVHVYDHLNEFKLKPGDQPVKFVSVIGNSDSPYPYLIGKEHVYSLWNGKSIFVYPVSSFDTTKYIVDQELMTGEFKDAESPAGRETIVAKQLCKPKSAKTRKNRRHL